MKAPALPQSLSSSSSSSSLLFVYGTLMAPAVMETLLGRQSCRQQQPALLKGYTRHPVRHAIYPGLVLANSSNTAVAAATTTGILYTDVTPAEWKRLDWFEDVDYTRQTVSVSLLLASSSSPCDTTTSTTTAMDNTTEVENDDDSTTVIQAQTYVWTNPLSQLDLTREWSFEHDLDEATLQDYLQRTVRPCRSELDRLGL